MPWECRHGNEIQKKQVMHLSSKAGHFTKGGNIHTQRTMSKQSTMSMWRQTYRDRGGRGSKELVRMGQLGKQQQQCMSVGCT